ncbi:MAG: mannitol dehydrogenase family protein [Treponema sp.]|jgi:fructuronate reductase|nr:mannitol dehydrogenase family protein [Treponema sp.]
MRLTNDGLLDTASWERAGIALPRFDRRAMTAATLAQPEWVHFGAGNIFRAFLAALQQDLLDAGLVKTGLIVAAGYDGDIIDHAYLPFDKLCLAVTLKAGGSIEKRVLACIAEALRMDRQADFDRLKAVFRAPSLKMASLTITEKGYSLVAPDGKPLPTVAADFEAGPTGAIPQNYIARLTALCYERFRAGKLPLALVSMDNCSHNGDKLFAAIETVAAAWTARGLADVAFLDYIRDSSTVAFPLTMIDKITPQPDAEVQRTLTALGLEGMDGVRTAKGTLVTPFVNAEEAQYLVIEDRFPAGRLPLDKAGVMFTDRNTVDKVEKMKVCTCLNPLHTALAVFGCLLGYTKISAEMQNPDLVKLIERIGYHEGLRVVVDPGIISPKAFIDEVIQVRFPNPFVPDTPQRIATDTSQKIPIRFGETIKAYMAGGTGGAKLSTTDLTFIPLVLAAWIRYLLGVNDSGETFTVSPDPLYESLVKALSGVKLGQSGPFHAILSPILADKRIFAVDLYEAGLGERVESAFADMMAGHGAVAATLKRALATYA